MTPEDAILRWQLANVAPLAETPTSRLWRAESDAVGPVVLKVLKPYGADEIHGVHLMMAAAGRGMARIFDLSDNAVLMEWLPGQTLASLVREGHDHDATAIIADVARAVRTIASAGLIPLEQHLRAMFAGDLGKVPQSAHRDIAAAREIGQWLLAHAPAPVALHGDLHHGNILQSPRGWLAIDAKGLIGDPAYEFANAFRNPEDRQDLARTPARIADMATFFAAELGADPGRICAWAAAHCACSIFWSADDGNDLTHDLLLLPLLLSAAATM